MLHTPALFLTILLGVSGALTGNAASLLILMYLMIFRSPRASLSPLMWWSCVILHVSQVVASLLVNLITDSTAAFTANVFSDSANGRITKGFGVYDWTGHAGKYVASVVPPLCIILFCVAARRSLQRSAKRRSAASSQSILAFWGFLSACAALIEPTLLGGVFLVQALVVFSCVALDGAVGHQQALQWCSLASTLVGAALLGVWGAAQNAAASPTFSNLNSMFGLTVFCNLSTWREARCLIQYMLVLLVTILAQVVTSIADRLAVDTAASSLRRRNGAAAPPSAGGHQQQQHTSLLSAEHLSILENEGAAQQRRSQRQSSEGGFRTRDGAESATGGGGSQSFLSQADVVDALVVAVRVVSGWILDNFIVLPLFPIGCMAALIIVFPSIPSLVLFPTLYVGLLQPTKVQRTLVPSSIVFAACFVSQYFIYAVTPNSSSSASTTLLQLFLHESATGWQLVEIGCNLLLFLVLLATYVHQRRVGDHALLKVRRQREQQQEEDALVEHEEQRRQSQRRFSRTSFSAAEQRPARHHPPSSRDIAAATTIGSVPDVTGSDTFVREASALMTRESTTTTVGGGGGDQLVNLDEDILGAERVRRLTRIFEGQPGQSHRVSCFHTLTDRVPTEDELLSLGTADPLPQVLRRRKVLALQPMWRRLIHDSGILLRFYSLNFTILFTFVAGSCVYKLDIIHAAVLFVFLGYFLLPQFARRHWNILVALMCLLTAFEVLMTFVTEFTTVPVYMLPSIRSATVGLVPMPSRWSAVSYFVVLFFVCLQLHVLGSSGNTWDELLTLYEWRQLLSVSAVQEVVQRVTLVIAATVFVCLGIFEERSLLVEGFLVFFLVICICTAVFRAGAKVQWVLWTVASVYAGLVMLCVCLYQFQELANFMDRQIDSIPGCSSGNNISSTVTHPCQSEIGVVAPAGYVLTYFLAPWFIALVTAVAHTSSVARSEEVHAAAPLGGHLSGSEGASSPTSPARALLLPPPPPSSSYQAPVVVGGSTSSSYGSASSPPPALPAPAKKDTPASSTSSSHPGRHTNPSCGSVAEMNVIQQSFQQQEQQPLLYSPTARDQHHQHGSSANHATVMRAAARHFCAKDQVLFHLVFWCVQFAHRAGDVAAWIGREYGAVIVWCALYIAATAEYTLLAAGYALFFIFDLSSLAVFGCCCRDKQGLDVSSAMALMYCVVHLTILYSYQFTFTPKINAKVANGVDWAELLGFIKEDSSQVAAVGPVLVFFAVLFRALTLAQPRARNNALATNVDEDEAPRNHPSSVLVAVEEHHHNHHHHSEHAGDTKQTHLLVAHHRLHHLTVSTVVPWLQYLNVHALPLVGYETFVLLSLINLQASASLASGCVLAIAVMAALWAGRNAFLNSPVLITTLQVIISLLFAFELAVQLNLRHNLWEVATSSSVNTDEWRLWAFEGRVESMFLYFASIVILHSVRAMWNRYTRTGETTLDGWVRRHLYFNAPTLMTHLKDVYGDTHRRAELIRDGHNLHQEEKKRAGNMLKHASDERLVHVLPPIPDTDQPWRPVAPTVQREGREADVVDRGDDGARLLKATSSAATAAAHGAESTTVRFHAQQARAHDLWASLPPPPAGFFLHDTVMNALVKLFSLISPVALTSFYAGSVGSSLIGVALITSGLLQFAYQDFLNWKFYRLWPRLNAFYTLVLVVVPVVSNIPAVADWLLGYSTAASIVGLRDANGPVGFSGASAAVLLMTAMQTRVFESFWFERVIRHMREHLHSRAEKHRNLEAQMSERHRRELEEVQRRDEELRAKLQEVRSTYAISLSNSSMGSISVMDKMLREDSVLNDDLNAVAATNDARGEASASVGEVPSPKLLRLSFRLQRRATSPLLPPSSPPQEGAEQSSATQKPAASTTTGDALGDQQPVAQSEPNPPPAAAEVVGTGGKDDGGATATKSIEIAPSKYEKLQELSLTLTEWLIPFTYFPPKLHEELMCSPDVHPFLCLLYALVCVAERHTAQIVVIFIVANFSQSGTLFDCIPALVSLVILSVYDPFAPLRCYEVLSLYIVAGIIIKAILIILAAQLSMDPGFTRVLRWLLVDTGDVSTGEAASAYSDLILDFIVFASIAIHEHAAFSNGVYSFHRGKTITSHTDKTNDGGVHRGYMAIGNGGEGNDDDDGDEKDAEEATPLMDPYDDDYSGGDNGRSPPPPGGASGRDLLLHHHGGAQQHRESEHHDGVYIAIPNDAALSHGVGGDPVPQTAPASSAEIGRLEDDPQSLAQFVRNFIENATSVKGCGVDLYFYYALAELCTLLILVFNYYAIAGQGNGSIVQNVQDNVLPGPFVLGVFATLIAMIIDRAVYAANSMTAKLVFHVVYGTVICVLFCLWRQVTKPVVLTAGICFFIFKCGYLYLSCWQLQGGFPRHRAHDPFTSKPGDILPWLGYTIFRSIPFLWEMRVVTDWTFMNTALRLNCYLKVENLFDTVYNRLVSIEDSKAQQTKMGSAIKLSAKLSDGLVRLVIILLAIIFPLMLYSTFNPATTPNEVTQVQVSVSFESTSPFFQSSLFSILQYPGDLALWLARTRPILGSYGITNSDKTVQMMELSSCSDSLWTISPQAQRLLIERLNNTYYNTSTTTLNLEMIMQRGGVGEQTGQTQTIQHPWLVPWNVAGDILQTMMNVSNSTSTSISKLIPLNDFYSPYIFNQPTQIQYFPTLANSPNLDTEECSIYVKSEYDPLLQTRAHYWCFICNSIFTSGNEPTDNTTAYPEWNCIAHNIGCNKYNFETYPTNYTPVPVYFVIFSDPIPQTFSFLPNIGIIALYTTFVLALGRVFRSMFETTASNIVQMDMADPTPVAKLIEYISIARSCEDLPLEQSVYYELIDLMRSPERLLQLTGLHRKAYRDEHGAVLNRNSASPTTLQ